MVSWMRGLNRHPAKVLVWLNRPVGSNPTLTTKLRILAAKNIGLESRLFLVRFQNFPQGKLAQLVEQRKQYPVVYVGVC